MDPSLAGTLDWGELAPLRLRARAVAEGVYAGVHRSARRGSGVEFGGHRAYVPGDDLRFLDRRALLRHDRLVLREFQTDTDRALWLLMDASASMGFRGPRARGAKLAYAALLAAALARLALRSRDPVGLAWIAGEGRLQRASAGRDGYERIVDALSAARAVGDASQERAVIERAVAPVARRARSGSIVVLFTDLLDLPSGSADALAPLGTRGRSLTVVEVRDRSERTFSLEGTVRLRALEGGHVVETDAEAARERYLARLTEHDRTWHDGLLARGARVVRCSTDEPPAAVVRDVVRAVAREGT